MGKRYTEQEKHRIQELVDQGHTDESIAHRLGRSTNAVRNYRHRTNIRSKETITLQQIKQEIQELTRQNQETNIQFRQLEAKRDQVKQALQIEEKIFHNKLETALIKLRDMKPELFTITIQDQINKLTLELASSFIQWLIK